MSNALQLGLPLLLVVALIALIYKRTGTPKAAYQLPQPWTHAPILWSATDEPIPAGHHGGHHELHHEEGESVLNVGGGASGRW